ncbi:hypothetical protein BGX26_004352 [Mortierella sp. AD094]|nr:hypothetical protein BGX26_004352 [Mortierella sp. AD094]
MKVGDINNIYRLYRPACPIYPANNSRAPGMSSHNVMRLTGEVQRITGYRFKKPDLLVQALSHQSASIGSTNQRLELLGDGVPGFLAAEHYCRKRLDTPVGDFRTFKSMILSNNALGSLFASLDLDNVLMTGKNINSTLKEDSEDVVHLRETGETDWTDLYLSKTLGDAMEALVGAIFVDAGFALGPIQDVLCRILYPFVDGSDLKCPIGKLSDSSFETPIK